MKKVAKNETDVSLDVLQLNVMIAQTLGYLECDVGPLPEMKFKDNVGVVLVLCCSRVLCVLWLIWSQLWTNCYMSNNVTKQHNITDGISTVCQSHVAFSLIKRVCDCV